MLSYPYDDLLNKFSESRLFGIFTRIGLVGAEGSVGTMVAAAIMQCIALVRSFLLPLVGIYILVQHLYGDDWRRGLRHISVAALILIVLSVVYSLPEIWWLWTGNSTCAEILKAVNVYLYDPVSSHGWWPPLLWRGQVRSLFPEPSFFAITSAFFIPLLWYQLWHEKRYWAVIPAFILALMIFMTNSRTAIILYLAEVLLLCVGCLVLHCQAKYRIIGTMLLITVFAFALNLATVQYFHNNGKDVIAEEQEVVAEYLERNVTSAVGIGKRSNTARYGNTMAALYTGLDYPLMGVGYGYQNSYLHEHFPVWAQDNKEVQNWWNALDPKSGKRGGYPVLNEFTHVLAWCGFPGLLLFIFPIFYATYRIFTRIRPRGDLPFLCLVIAALGLIAAMFSNHFFYNYPVALSLLLCAVDNYDTNTRLR